MDIAFKFTSLQILFCIIWPSILGIFLHSIGQYIFSFIASKLNLIERIKNEFIDQHANAVKDSNLSRYVDSLSEEGAQHLNDMKEEDKNKFFEKVIQVACDSAARSIRQRLNTGIALAPLAQFSLSSQLREMRAYVLGPTALFELSLSLIGCALIVIPMSLFFVLDKNWIFILWWLIISLIGLFLLWRICLIFYYSYLQQNYSIFIGIGQLSATSSQEKSS